MSRSVGKVVEGQAVDLPEVHHQGLAVGELLDLLLPLMLQRRRGNDQDPLDTRRPGEDLGRGDGLDRFALPLCASQLNNWRFAAIDCTPLTHVRVFSSLEKRFSNGLLSKEEELLIRQRLMNAMGFEIDQASLERLEASVD